MRRRSILGMLASSAILRGQIFSGNSSMSGQASAGGLIPVVPPTALQFTPSFAVYRTNGGQYTTTLNILNAIPSTTTTYYVGPGGSNTNSGLSHALRVRSLQQAITLATNNAGAVQILVDPAIYRWSNKDGSGIPDDFNGNSPSCTALVIQTNGGGQFVSVHDQPMPAYAATSDPNIYVSTYTTSQLPSQCAWDADFTNVYGRPQALRNLTGSLDGNTSAIFAGINTLWTLRGQGAMYLDQTNSLLYMRTINNRQPDSAISVGRGQVGNSLGLNWFMSLPFNATQKIWVSNMDVWGGQGLNNFSNTVTGDIRLLNAWFYNCASFYSSFNGVSIQSSGFVYLVNCISSDSFGDGLDYQTANASVGGILQVYEINCQTTWTGNTDIFGDASSNGSSAHVGCRVVRINGSYTLNQNRTIHDIEDCVSWNLGCDASQVLQSGTQSASFVSGYASIPTNTSIVYLDGCTSSGVTYNLQAYNSGTVLTRNMNTSGFTNLNSGGTIGTY